MRRIFAGIKIEPDRNFKKILSDVKARLQDEKIKWTEQGNLHLTLAFLGNTPDDRITDVSAIIKEQCEGKGSFEISLKGFGVFKNLRDPKVFWTGIEPSEKLTSLQDQIAQSLTNAALYKEDKPFSPHLTIGRIKQVRDNDALKVLLLKYHGTDIQKVAVDKVILYESILRQEGPLYTALEEFNL